MFNYSRSSFDLEGEKKEKKVSMANHRIVVDLDRSPEGFFRVRKGGVLDVEGRTARDVGNGGATKRFTANHGRGCQVDQTSSKNEAAAT